MLAVVKYVTMLLRTGLLGAARSGIKCKQRSTELSIDRLSMKRSKLLEDSHVEYGSVASGRNPR